MSYVGSGRNYFYEGLFDAEEPQDAEQRRAFARDRKAQAEQIRVLRAALENILVYCFFFERSTALDRIKNFTIEALKDTK